MSSDYTKKSKSGETVMEKKIGLDEIFKESFPWDNCFFKAVLRKLFKSVSIKGEQELRKWRFCRRILAFKPILLKKIYSIFVISFRPCGSLINALYLLEEKFKKKIYLKKIGENGYNFIKKIVQNFTKKNIVKFMAKRETEWMRF